MQTKPEDVMPWKINGERWHLGPKGFPAGKKLQWDPALLPRVLQLLREIEPGLEIDWGVRYFITLRAPGVSRFWAQIQTKRPNGLICRFIGKKGQFNLDQFADLGAAPRLDTETSGTDVLWLTFQQLDPSRVGRLKGLLAEHLRGFREAFGKGRGLGTAQ
jgi:excinuclease ABC subunit A